MELKLYPADLTKEQFAAGNATLCKLPFAIDPLVSQKINGDWSLTFDYPACKEDRLTLDMLVEADGQLYRIDEVGRSSSTNGERIEIHALHIMYDLRDKQIVNIETSETTPGGINQRTALQQVLYDTPFTDGVVDTDIVLDYLDILQKDVMWAIKEQILQLWGGELEPDNWTINIRKQMGQDMNVQLRYGKNIKGVRMQESLDGTITRLHILGYQGANIESINNGNDYIDSPNIGLYSNIKEGLVTFPDDDLAEDLLSKGQEYLATVDTPRIRLSVDLAAVKGSVQYQHYKSLEDVRLGDTVTVYHKRLGIDIVSRVQKREYNPITGENKKIELGNDNSNLFTEIASMQQAAEVIKMIADRKGHIRGEKLRGVIDLLTTRLYASGSYSNAVVNDKTGILFENTNQDSPDYGAMYIGPGIFAIASEKNADNSWEWRTFGTGQGFYGNELVAGSITANKLASDVGEKLVISSNKAIVNIVQDVDSAQEDISTLKQTAEGIQTEVNDAKGSISALTQTAQGLSSRVQDAEGNISSLEQTSQSLSANLTSATNDLQSQINAVPGQITAEVSNVQIGGVNIMRGTRDFSVQDGVQWYTYGGVWRPGDDNWIISEVRDGFAVISRTGSWRGVGQKINYKPGRYIFSAFIRGNVEYNALVNSPENDAIKFSNNSNSISIPVSTQWERIEVPFIITRNAEVFVRIEVRTADDDKRLDIYAIQIEEGTKATDWTPHPLDVYGGSNLLEGSKFFDSSKWLYLEHWNDAGNYNGFQVKSRTNAWRGIHQGIQAFANEIFTFSFYIRSDVETSVICQKDPPSGEQTLNITAPVSTSWTRRSISFVCTDSQVIYPRVESKNSTDTIYICGLKLERGTVATPWDFNPDDPSNSVKTSHITIEDDRIDIATGGKLNMQGGSVNLEAGSDMAIKSGANFNLGAGAGKTGIGMSNSRADNYFLWAGASYPADAPFYVDMSGMIHFSNISPDSYRPDYNALVGLYKGSIVPSSGLGNNGDLYVLHSASVGTNWSDVTATIPDNQGMQTWFGVYRNWNKANSNPNYIGNGTGAASMKNGTYFHFVAPANMQAATFTFTTSKKWSGKTLSSGSTTYRLEIRSGSATGSVVGRADFSAGVNDAVQTVTVSGTFSSGTRYYCGIFYPGSTELTNAVIKGGTTGIVLKGSNSTKEFGLYVKSNGSWKILI